MENILGYDCDNREIYEYRILRAIWSNTIDIERLTDADPRQYCALVADDGNAYAISVYDWWNKELIREREKLEIDANIPVIVKPITEMANYECAVDCEGNEFNYDLDRNELKEQLNTIINAKVKKKVM